MYYKRPLENQLIAEGLPFLNNNNDNDNNARTHAHTH